MTVVRHVEVPIHGAYLLEPSSRPGAPLVVGFHGYGEPAERHLDELRRIPGAAGWTLCAVRALHPFYTRAGEVVGCWMTRQDRELAIADNVRYVAAAVAALRRELPASGPLVYVGFSQGAAMAWRAAAAAGHPCRGVVAVGGDVPPDLDGSGLAALPPALLGRGLDDDWYDEPKLAGDLERLTGAGVDARPLRYPGGHAWTDEVRRAAGAFIAEVTG